MSNFTFLNEKWPILAENARLAETYIISDPNAAMFKMRIFSEKLIDLILVVLKIDTDYGASQHDKIQLLRKTKVNSAIPDLFDIVRRLGNKAAHDGYNDQEDAKRSLLSIYKLSAWFYAKVTGDKSLFPLIFNWSLLQSKLSIKMKIDEDTYTKEIEVLKQAHQQEIEELKKKLAITSLDPQKIEDAVVVVTNSLGLTEAETRKELIDIMLKEAGWDIDNRDQVKLEHPLDGFPNKSGKGRADYVLWDKKRNPIAVIEAKKTATDAVTGRHQAKLYADCIEKKYSVRPVIFYTNGHEIFIWDDQHSAPRQIWGFYTLDDLEYLMFQHKSRKALSTVTIDGTIAGRPYQIQGIKQVYEKFDHGGRKALLVMATGCGKTRTVIALTKGMMNAQCAKRILFLADRDELVRQAKEQKNSFKTFMPDTPSTRITGANADNRESSLYFATYQTMIHHYHNYSVGFFDMVICDESHRSIYQTYRDILQYFDAHIIGLTATPVDYINRNTFNIFECPAGDPTYYYAYEEACDHIPPYLLRYKALDATTKFLRQGIKWENLTEEQKTQLEEDGIDESQINFDKEVLEEYVTNKDTNRFILRTLMTKGIRVGDDIGKTILFAKNINHAKLLIELFDEMYPQYYGHLAAIIHSKITNKDDLLNDFKEKDRPRIAISVDMLDTGIDVPEIVNLVFAKPIYSKVKFMQMLGRGTRLCFDLFDKGKNKEYFMVIDHWKNFEFFDIEPDGKLPTQSKSALQMRLELRTQLIQIVKEKGLADKQADLIADIRKDINALPQKSVEVRRNWKTLEWLKVGQAWNAINDDLITKLNTEVSPLMQWVDSQGQKDALWFDNQMYRMQLYKLNNDPRLGEHIVNLVHEFSRLRLNLNQFNGIREYVIELIQPTYWENIDYDGIERARQTLRDYMKYRGEKPGSPFLKLDLNDTDHQFSKVKDATASYTANMDPYEERVKQVLEELMEMQLVIQKIRRGQILTAQDIDAIYSIFGSGQISFSLADLSQSTHVKQSDLIGLLRKFVGVDVDELDRRFSQFIQQYSGKISALQISILEIIKKDIIKNKGISFASLYEPPYTSSNQNGIHGIFAGKMADEVFALIAPYKVELEEKHA
jgi:type I restriction enzyme R subunit